MEYESSLLTTQDDLGTSYYFRGNVENYLDFAGFTWRVVRINEDGTVRLILNDRIDEKQHILRFLLST